MAAPTVALRRDEPGLSAAMGEATKSSAALPLSAATRRQPWTIEFPLAPGTIINNPGLQSLLYSGDIPFTVFTVQQ